MRVGGTIAGRRQLFFARPGASSIGLGVGIAAAALALATTVGADDGKGSTSQTASRVIDRAFLCTNATRAGARTIGVSAKSGFRDSGMWKWVASIGIGNRGTTLTKLPSGGNTDTNWGVGVVAGAGRIARDPSVPYAEPRLTIWSRWSRACSPASPRRVPLVARGLSGGVAGHFGDRFTCAVPRRILVRVQAAFVTSTTLRLDRASRFLVARGSVRGGFVAARTESGRPLAFAAVSDSARARIFTAPGCLPD